MDGGDEDSYSEARLHQPPLWERNEMATRTDSRYLRAILKSNVLAMGCWRLGGHITAKNEALVRLIGYTNKEMKDGPIGMRDITPPEYQPLDLQALREARAKGECSPFEKEILHKSGRRIPVLMGGSTFEGMTDAGAFFFVDLRNRRRAISSKRPVPDELFNFTDRQRAICLLLSYGEPDKRIATLLDLGLRTVELDKQRAASALKLATGALAVWSVENRQGLIATMKNVNPLPEAAAKIIQRACSK